VTGFCRRVGAGFFSAAAAATASIGAASASVTARLTTSARPMVSAQ
jgi:hypothetical protein